MNPIWSEEHKQRYIKNVTREYKIHREMRHPRVVDFYDVFEIDMNSFATVLEYCKGIDLDEKYVQFFFNNVFSFFDSTFFSIMVYAILISMQYYMIMCLFDTY